MHYVLLIYGDEAGYARLSQEEQAAMFKEYTDFTEEVRNRGILNGGEPLMPTSSATTIRVRDGKLLTTDGPFAETKEQLGGYYILDCKNLDEAIELASRIPGARSGSIEIRPIAQM